MRKAVPRLFLVLTILISAVIPTTVSAGEFLYTADTLPTSNGWQVYKTNSYPSRRSAWSDPTPLRQRRCTTSSVLR